MSSISYYRHHDVALAPANIAFQVKDLLPRPKNQLAIRDGHGQRRPEPCCLQVGVAVAVVPCLLVAVAAAGRDQLIQKRGQVLLQPRLEFNRTDRGSAADVENVDGPGLDARGAHDRSHFSRSSLAYPRD